MSLSATFGLILICFHALAIETNGYHIQEHAAYATSIKGFIESLKPIIRSGNESLGIPPLDPFLAEELPIEVDLEDVVKVKLDLFDVDVRGLSEFDVNKGEFEMLSMKLVIDLTWPLVYATANYNINGTLGGEMPIFGKGDITAGVKGFNFFTEISFKLKNLKYVEVKNIILKIALGGLDFKITGLFNDEELSELVSSMISEMVPDLIKENHDEIVGYIIPILKDKINEILEGKTISDIIKIIGGYSQENQIKLINGV
ncbi:PREDICTED: uncharacterized protein LOC106742839 [Dinoponera quadriceps]|uniref:Uncharacterized protein LOC106742839 n=1 Tax=Dinoponera quadriceps TaxID=609295 RepID=A0A6P3X0C2_DINQU|nr:PREDICTED: uncharacterized protein LOC106742839 [Dinoponera quadriceps]